MITAETAKVSEIVRSFPLPPSPAGEREGMRGNRRGFIPLLIRIQIQAESSSG